MQTINTGSKEEKNHKQYATGAHREEKDGKGRFDLLSPRAIKRVALRLEYGARKYGDKDWDNGLPINTLLDSALRHIFQYMEDKNNEDHLAASVTNLMQAIEVEEKIKEGKIKKEDLK